MREHFLYFQCGVEGEAVIAVTIEVRGMPECKQSRSHVASLAASFRTSLNAGTPVYADLSGALGVGKRAGAGVGLGGLGGSGSKL